MTSYVHTAALPYETVNIINTYLDIKSTMKFQTFISIFHLIEILAPLHQRAEFIEGASSCFEEAGRDPEKDYFDETKKNYIFLWNIFICLCIKPKKKVVLIMSQKKVLQQCSYNKNIYF